MTVRPGRSLLGVGALMAGVSLLAFLWPAALWAVVAIGVAGGMLAIFDYRALKSALERVTVSRRMPAVVGRGRAFPASLQIATADAREWRGTVRDTLPGEAVPNVWIAPIHLRPLGVTTEVEQPLQIPLRGEYQFGPVWIRLRGPLQLLEMQRAFACTGSVRVLPEEYVQYAELHKESADELRLLDQIRHSRQQGAGTEFESLSEYREGDDPRRIDWRATARSRYPIVRRFQVERHRDLIILLDCGRLMGASAGNGTKLDRAVDAALMLGRVAVLSGDRCGLGVFDDRVLGYLPPLGGTRAVSILTNSVYALRSEFRESDFSQMFATLQSRQHKRALVVVLSDIVDEETSTRYRASLARLARRHAVLFAALRTPALRALQHAQIETLLDGYRTAVTFRILRERERAIHSLRHTGVHILDVEPSRLTVPLINQYIDLRQRNLV